MFNDSILCQIMSYFSSFKIMSNELNLETHNVRYYQRITIKQKFKESLPEFIFTKTWKINIWSISVIHMLVYFQHHHEVKNYLNQKSKHKLEKYFKLQKLFHKLFNWWTVRNQSIFVVFRCSDNFFAYNRIVVVTTTLTKEQSLECFT